MLSKYEAQSVNPSAADLMGSCPALGTYQRQRRYSQESRGVHTASTEGKEPWYFVLFLYLHSSVTLTRWLQVTLMNRLSLAFKREIP